MNPRIPNNAVAGSLRDALLALPARWRVQAAELDGWGGAGPAAALKRASDELEAALNDAGAELLTLPLAAREVGRTADHIGRLIRAGKLQNAGRSKAPRVTRADLLAYFGSLPMRTEPRTLDTPKRRAARRVLHSSMTGGK